MKSIIVAGGFDPVHRGHLDHIRKARALGDRLIAITHPDEILVAKKGYCFMPLADRKAILESIKWVDKVVISVDTDGTVAKTLEMIRQNTEGELIFAKGGDRAPDKVPIPSGEVETCERLGIKLVYGIGSKLDSSQDIIKRVIKQIGGNL